MEKQSNKPKTARSFAKIRNFAKILISYSISLTASRKCPITNHQDSYEIN